MNRTAVSAIAVLAAIAASTPSAVASVADESKPSASTSSPESISDQDFAGSEGVGRYVLADSPSEANRVLDVTGHDLGDAGVCSGGWGLVPCGAVGAMVVVVDQPGLELASAVVF